MRRFVKDNRGASSVLVILLMVVLVIFALTALSSSLAGMRLSDKNRAWNTEYYLLETKAEEMLYRIDAVLADAENRAVKSVMFEFDENGESPGIDAYGTIFKKEYMEFALSGLLELDCEVHFELNGKPEGGIPLEDDTGDIFVFAVFSEGPGENAKNLDVEIKIKPPEYEIAIGEGEMTGKRVDPGEKRYKVTLWKEWQYPFEYEGDMGFEDF